MTDYSIPPTKVYCEDDYFAESLSEQYHLKCDRTIQVPETPLAFKYSRFNEYLKIRTEIERYNRLIDCCKGVNSAKSGLDNFTDEKLKDELFEVYGDLDEESERFKLIFRNYKEQRLEQVKEWIDNEKNFTNKYVGQGEEGKKEYLNEEATLLDHFTKEEIISFKTIAKFNEKAFYPFVLPRKKKQGASVAQDPKKSKHKVQSHLSQRNEIICGEIKAILHDYPCGLVLHKLLFLCNERLGKKKIFLNIKPESIGYLIKERIVFSQNVFQKDSDVVFPFDSSFKQNFWDILWNLKHRLLVVLNLAYGIVEINECLELCSKIFKTDYEGVPYPPYIDWGFKSGRQFVQWLLLEKWNSPEVEIIQLNVENQENQFYLTKMTREKRKLLERKKEVQDFKTIATNYTAVPEPVPSPWNRKAVQTQPHQPPFISVDLKHVQPGDKINQEQNNIKPGDQFDCVVSLVNSPTNFYLVKLVKWKQLERLFNELRDYWNSLPVFPTTSPSLVVPDPHFLQRNYICLCKTDEDEVYRVVILGKPDLHHYQVYCIDYGDLFRVHHDQLRYLPKDLFYTLDAQSIACSLYNVACPSNTTDCWSKTICDYAKKLFNPADEDLPVITVTFKQRLNGNGKWLVKASAPQRNEMDFGENVMKFVNK